ncbi:J domain-containing protein DDB_G0295729 [Lucilia cuprina]|uniref:J domain-containing protein DDB_G0295729 n=1 Tax=Lucilia cuprina TaxID=7375 RepID=UPI001F06598B|nr:J domain-containing protein DDB_G0295729 [Lucilia cuprina]
MLSYVIPAQETTASNGRPMSENGSVRQQVPSPPRNLSLRLNSSYNTGGSSISGGSAGGGEQYSMHQQPTEVDALLANVAESCDERTHLLNDDANPTPPPRIKRQNSNNSNSNNNNSFSLNNNANNDRSCSVLDRRDGCDDVVNVNVSIDNDETFSDDAVTANEMTMNALDSDISDRQSLHQNTSSNPRLTMTTTTTKKQKLSKLGSNKTVGLKRVSFGSSKGSMVETLVFETPTPLSEHVEPNFGFGSDTDYKANMDDSGIEVQEESERSIVRVSIYQSSQPQQICPPEYFTKFEDNLDNSLSNYNCNLEDIMTTASPIPGYDRQQSTDSGWDNPFRPGGDLSREADEIVKMISGGKPITPTEEHAIGNGKSQTNGTAGNGTVVTEDITKSNVSPNQSAQNGTNGTHRIPTSTATTGGGAVKPAENKGVTSSAQVSKQVVPGPTSASHVVIDEKKNKKKGCCVVQ